MGEKKVSRRGGGEKTSSREPSSTRGVARKAQILLRGKRGKERCNRVLGEHSELRRWARINVMGLIKKVFVRRKNGEQTGLGKPVTGNRVTVGSQALRD